MTLPRAAFERGVRRLDGPESRRFVADLFEARGHRTAVEGRVVTATDGSGESTRLLVVDGVRSLAATVREPGVDAVVVTDGRIGATARSLTARAASRGAGSDPTAVLGPGTLYEWFAYAVDADAQSALADRYLDATERRRLGRGWIAFADAVGDAAGRIGRLRPPTRRTASLVLAALLVLGVTAVAGPAGPLATVDPGATGGDAGPTPAVTAVPVTATAAPATTEAGADRPDVCPPPPVDAHPAALRPGVIRTASAGGLDGWRLLVTQNISEYEFDPNDQQADAAPEIRHVAVFETPGGVRLRLVLDRWGSVARAERALTEGSAWALGLRWGTYTAGVEWDSGDATGDASARHLLAAVTTPDGTSLDGACVSALATGPATNDGSATA